MPPPLGEVGENPGDQQCHFFQPCNLQGCALSSFTCQEMQPLQRLLSRRAVLFVLPAALGSSLEVPSQPLFSPRLLEQQPGSASSTASLRHRSSSVRVQEPIINHLYSLAGLGNQVWGALPALQNLVLGRPGWRLRRAMTGSTVMSWHTAVQKAILRDLGHLDASLKLSAVGQGRL